VLQGQDPEPFNTHNSEILCNQSLNYFLYINESTEYLETEEGEELKLKTRPVKQTAQYLPDFVQLRK